MQQQSTDHLDRLARTFSAALDLLDKQHREPDRWEEECLTYALGAMACGLYPAAAVELEAFARPLAQRTPAGLPSGIPGMGEEIEGATQHAPHPARHSTSATARRRDRNRPW